MLSRYRDALPLLTPGLLCACVSACGQGDERLPFDFPDVCAPGQAPDEACFVEKRAPGSERLALAHALADRWIAVHPAEALPWDWGEGVLLHALMELHRVSPSAAIRDYVQAYHEHHLAEGYDIWWSDTCPPALSALALHRELGDARYLQPAADVIAYLNDVAYRTPEGGISHLGTLEGFEPTLWLDSLFMFGRVLDRWYEQTGDEAALHLMGQQLRIFGDLMQDASGWWVHAVHWPVTSQPGVFWGRGNGWVTAAGYDHLRILRNRGTTDPEIRERLARQAAAIVAAQDPETGLHWTVLTRPGETYLETSATALFVQGLARGYRYGLLDASVLPALALGLDGIASRIARDAEDRPYVTGISGPTTAGGFQTYAGVDLEDDLSYGVGAVILALIETSGLAL
jgi:unsaturated rhamnogalacturonyl hydrolase